LTDPKHLVRTRGLDWSQAPPAGHPFNPAAEMQVVGLGERTGLTRLPVSLVRVAPGKESFIAHAHWLTEEFVFILEGEGQAVLDGQAIPVGPGDFLGFPTDGVAHQLVNTGASDLVYLTGGERTAVDVSDMPSIGKTLLARNGRMVLLDNATAETVTREEWSARATLKPPST
jgi:uncharacterized cupin superfamily protein